MTETDIHLREIHDTDRAIRRIEDDIAAHALSIHSKGTLKTYPGCVHWHVKRGREHGTLEITLWPAKRRVWFKVQAGRRAAWIDEILPILKRALERRA